MPLHDTTSPIPDLIIDQCDEAYYDEVNSWRIIALRDSFKAVRDRLFSEDVKIGEAIPATTSIEYLDFTTEAYAIAFLRWRGTKAALEHFLELVGPTAGSVPGDTPSPT